MENLGAQTQPVEVLPSNSSDQQEKCGAHLEFPFPGDKKPEPLKIHSRQRKRGRDRKRAARMSAASPSTTPSTLSLLSSSKSLSSLPFVHRLSVTNSNASSTLFAVEAKAVTRRESRTARHVRIRKKVEGTPERPRLCVFCSNKHLYVQVIDDTKMHTLASASIMQKPVSEEFDYSAGPTIEIAKKVGEAIAKVCAENGITKVAFDRGGYPYHGRIEAPSQLLEKMVSSSENCSTL